jgi:hypothetical protein
MTRVLQWLNLGLGTINVALAVYNASRGRWTYLLVNLIAVVMCAVCVVMLHHVRQLRRAWEHRQHWN